MDSTDKSFFNINDPYQKEEDEKAYIGQKCNNFLDCLHCIQLKRIDNMQIIMNQGLLRMMGMTLTHQMMTMTTYGCLYRYLSHTQIG